MRHRQTSGSDGHIYYLDRFDGFTQKHQNLFNYCMSAIPKAVLEKQTNIVSVFHKNEETTLTLCHQVG